MTIGSDDRIRAFLADEARRALTAAPSLDQAVGQVASRVAGRKGGASQRLMVLLAATLVLVAALGTAVAIGSGILRLPQVVDSEEPSADLGVFAPVAGRVVYCTNSGLWAVDPSAPSPASTLVRLEGTADTDGLCASDTVPLAWSSDGTELLLRREDLTDQGLCCPDHLYILRADGTETQLNRDAMYTSGATIAPDGSRVVFAAGEYRGPPGLFVIDAEGGRAARIAEVGESPTFSPDGSQIAYVSTGPTRAHVWVANADGTDPREILADEPALTDGAFGGLTWSPAGDRIAMENRMEGSEAIYTFAPDGSDFTEMLTGAYNPHWSPDGSQIAYGMPGRDGVYLVGVGGSTVRIVDIAGPGPWHPGSLESAVRR